MTDHECDDHCRELRDDIVALEEAIQELKQQLKALAARTQELDQRTVGSILIGGGRP